MTGNLGISEDTEPVLSLHTRCILQKFATMLIWKQGTLVKMLSRVKGIFVVASKLRNCIIEPTKRVGILSQLNHPTISYVYQNMSTSLSLIG